MGPPCAMSGRRGLPARAQRSLALCLALGVLHRADAGLAKVDLRAADSEAGEHMEGEVFITVHEQRDGRTSNKFVYAFRHADRRCTPDAVTSGCRFAVHKGTNCSDPGINLRDKEYKTLHPWNHTRFNVTQQGTSNGSIVVWTDLQQAELYKHVVVVTDFDGAFAACGHILSNCIEVLGCRFFEWARWSTGVATFVAVVNSLWLIRGHLVHNKNYILGRHTARILLMVPIYSVQAYISLCLKVQAGTAAEFLKFFRELYEAVVIVSFLEFILICVGGAEYVIHRYDGARSIRAVTVAYEPSSTAEDEDVAAPKGLAYASERSSERQMKLRHICPWSFLCPAWGSARSMLRWCTLGTLSYVFVGFCVLLAAWIFGFVWEKHSYQYELLIKLGKMAFVISSMLAINSLFELAHMFFDDLHELSPLSKFVSVKIVIFFTFWQGLVLAALEKAGFFNRFLDFEHNWDTGGQISQAMQNCLICWEMCIASILHFWAFPPSDYRIVRKMAERQRFELNAPEDGDHLKALIGRGFQVVNLTDIFQITWHGFAPNHFLEKEVDDSESSQSSGSDVSEATAASDNDEEESPTRNSR